MPSASGAFPVPQPRGTNLLDAHPRPAKAGQLLKKARLHARARGWSCCDRKNEEAEHATTLKNDFKVVLARAVSDRRETLNRSVFKCTWLGLCLHETSDLRQQHSLLHRKKWSGTGRVL